jgi:holo-[acyl-carrier protein] synthase
VSDHEYLRIPLERALIVGIGIDLLEISEFENRLSRSPSLLRKVIPENSEHLNSGNLQQAASNFVAYEALFKALPESNKLKLFDYKLKRDDLGRPYFQFDSGSETMHPDQLTIQLSISNNGHYSVAVVIVEIN